MGRGSVLLFASERKTSFNFVRRSGKSVRSSAASSPLLPRGRSRCATAKKRGWSGTLVFDDFEGEAFVVFGAGGGKKRANGFGGAALAADNFAEVVGVDA